MRSHIDVEYLAAGGNRHPSVADWDPKTGVLAFGAGRNIALWKPQDACRPGLRGLITGHADNVNTLCFLTGVDQKESLLLSGSADKTIRVWSGTFESSGEARYIGTLKGHAASVNCIAACEKNSIAVSGAADGDLRVWRVPWNEHQAETSLLQTLTLSPKYFALSVALHQPAQGDCLLLATGGTKNIIQIYAARTQSPTFTFTYQVTLAGHEGWIRSLDFTPENLGLDADIILASSSQDKYIRLWRIRKWSVSSTTKGIENLSLQSINLPLVNRPHRFIIDHTEYSFSFEALLLGHEDWVYTARWNLNGYKLQLLSSSADNSLALWESDVNSGVWVCVARLGEISAQKGSTTATGSTGGFWCGLWSPDGRSVVSLGRTGSWRYWALNSTTGNWDQMLGVSGHTRDVRSLVWSKQGTYVLSVSADQTTRLHAPWIRDDRKSWHELSRPQIHGYDLNCVASVRETQFVSGADEKLLRVFDQPRPIAKLLHGVFGICTRAENELPETANMPVLGLSNKARDIPEGEYRFQSHETEEDTEEDVRSMHTLNVQDHSFEIDVPPFEDSLARHTLWPEQEKLYGHGFEISTLTCSHDGSLIASACKASSLEHAVIRLYGTDDWREIKPALKGHTLTITCMKFSHDDEYLLSVGRDRQLCIFSRVSHDSKKYQLIASDPRGHTRMILGASWFPQTSHYLFATASRDKTIKIWSLNSGSLSCKATILAPCAVTDIDFNFRPYGRLYALAAGLESGEVFLHIISPIDFQVKETFKLNSDISPCLAITRVAWQPTSISSEWTHKERESSAASLLAVSSEDGSLRIVSIELQN